MVGISKRQFQKLAVMSLGVVTLAGLSACATSSNAVQVASNAPITYKVGKGDARFASVTLPERRRSDERRRSHKAPTQPAPAYTDNFDTSSVDTTLYSHQKVGKTYEVFGKNYTPKHNPHYDIVGTASWYGDKFHGKPTATGEIFDKTDITAAHKSLPLNSILRVTNLENGRVLMVRLNDRGPFVGDRIIDLSEAAARQLGTIENGLARVRVQYAGAADPNLPLDMYKSRSPRKAKPVAPKPRDEELFVEAPRAPSGQTYQPLREQSSLGALEPLPYKAPVPAQPIAPASPDYSMQDYSTPDYDMPEAYVPEAYVPEYPSEDGGVVTMTIKGPIHMATNGPNAPKAHFIPGGNHTRYSSATPK